jgi:hypothetical protein
MQSRGEGLRGENGLIQHRYVQRDLRDAPNINAKSADVHRISA